MQFQNKEHVGHLQSLIREAERFKATIFQPLEFLRMEVLEQMTMVVDVQKHAWLEKLNRSLEHLNYIDKYLSENLDAICLNHTRIYVRRYHFIELLILFVLQKLLQKYKKETFM